VLEQQRAVIQHVDGDDRQLHGIEQRPHERTAARAEIDDAIEAEPAQRTDHRANTWQLRRALEAMQLELGRAATCERLVVGEVQSEGAPRVGCRECEVVRLVGDHEPRD
jgi:hypothetical protein